MKKPHRVRTPEETAIKVAEMRAAGKLPPRGKSHEWVRPEHQRTVTTKYAVTLPPCISLGEVIHEEPCSCGAAKKIAVHECQHAENKRASGANGLCVPLKLSIARIKDKDVKLSMLCCETCPLRCVTHCQ